MPRLSVMPYGRWSALATEIRRIDLVLNTTPDEVPDKCKTLCEIVLKSILVFSKAKTDDECDSMTMENLKELVCQTLSLTDAEKDLVKAEILFLARSRNVRGTAGHGRSLQRQQEIRDSANEKDNDRFLSVSDSLIPFLIETFEAQYPEPHEKLERSESFDAYLDSEFGTIQIYDAHYPASDVLHEVDPLGYELGLKSFSEYDGGDLKV